MIQLDRVPRLVATDLDGTVVRSDETVSPRTLAALKRLAAAGVILVGATGRGPRLLELCRNDVPSADFLVLGQGAFVYECRYDDTVVQLADRSVEGEVLHQALRLIEAEVGPVRALAEPADPDRHITGDPMPDWPWTAVTLETAPRDVAFHGPMVKGYFVSDVYTGPELLVAAKDVIDPSLVTVTESGVGMLEVCPVGVTKAAGIQVVLDKFGIDWADVLVFGDATNDLSMMEAAGHSVAMPNGHPWVQAAATEIAPAGNNDDGVAQYIEALLELL
ncbi:HAD family hydrolase [Glycomyces niveus]|uniref:HAD hydrolase family protein n=1 Tax=Glycomyces niveus TaxID=2820287 RepID=A0ABS3U7A9_9ACTN|nr:HAD hydrolase family protein [Glycomyces sp. NEAU-S30]MBO3734669.1 HAD hydrolase family protein [Glycomyces sp. NEAU-S30]